MRRATASSLALLLQRGRAFWGAEIQIGGPDCIAQCFASTGPRLLGRGDMKSISVPPSIILLQRGRAFWGAEINVDATGTPLPTRLQRGRAFWGAEIPPPSARRPTNHAASTGPRLLGRGDCCHREAGHGRGTRFNGAAPFGARRCGQPIPPTLRPATASTGPRLLGRGDSSRRAGIVRHGSSFNGAAPFGARRYRKAC